MASGITPPSAMEFSGPLDENWKFYKQKFELYLKASDMARKNSETKASILLSTIGDKALKIYNTFEFEEDKNKMEYEEIIRKFDNHFKPEKNTTYERHIFFLRNQLDGESIDAYVNELRQLSSTCEFGDLRDSLIKDRLILGITDTSIKQNLLQIKDLTLEKAIGITKLSERTKLQMKALSTEMSTIAVNKINFGKNKPSTSRTPGAYGNSIQPSNVQSRRSSAVNQRSNFQRENYGRPPSSAPPAAEQRLQRRSHQGQQRTKKTFLCRNCGTQHSINQCPAFGKQCLACDPHIGHLYSSLIADAAQRWHRIRNRGAEIKFATGTDEHGMKIQQAAELNNSSLPTYCSAVSDRYKLLADRFNIQYTDFIRTSCGTHKTTVEKFWNRLSQNGVIYESKYEGWYCVPDETFLSDFQLTKRTSENGEVSLVSSESGHPVEWTEERNYMFKLSSFRKELEHWLATNENAVKPQKFRKILEDLIRNEDALNDVSVSRPSSRAHWGVPVPTDQSQTVYVWLDALVNYLTAAGYSRVPEGEFNKIWPPDLQVIGKDILKFHGVYWPAFLIAAGLEPPRSILCHSHWTVDGEKMSKSKGNVIDPFQRSEVYTSDGLRYFLLREGVSSSDGNFSDHKVVNILNSELADTLGNLLSRCCGRSLNPSQVFPEFNPHWFEKVRGIEVTRRLIDQVVELPGVCENHYDDHNFYKAADAVISTLHTANLFFETMKPWELRKEPSRAEELNAVLHVTMETLRVASTLLQPLIPILSGRLLDKLRVSVDRRCFDDVSELSWTRGHYDETNLSSETAVVFKRIVDDKREKERGKVN